MKSILFFVLLLHVYATYAATAAQWRNRIIYQVLTDRFARTDGSTTAACDAEDRKYCGGTWRGLINKLDYIQDMGFTAVWISPVTENFEGSSGYGEAFHGYWQTNLNSLNSHFGSESDLKALSDALHSRGMYLMVDVVPNHFGWPGSPSTVKYSSFEPFNNSSFFHKFCQIQQSDYDNNQTNVENCWLGDNKVQLPDVNTSNARVISTLHTWIRNLVRTYSIDGLRIDTVKHVPKAFWPGFRTAAGVYTLGEVASGDPAYTLPYQSVLDGLLNYPLYYPLVRAFQSSGGSSMPELSAMLATVKNSAQDSTLHGAFLENHDQPRFPSLTGGDVALAMNAIAFTLMGDGVPILYAGQEQHFAGGNDPYNREPTWFGGYDAGSTLYGFVARVNQLRNRAMAQDPEFVRYKVYSTYSDEHTIVTRKGFDGFQVVGVFTNRGSNGGNGTFEVPDTGFVKGEKVVEVVGCTTLAAGENGNVSVPVGKGQVKLLYLEERLSGSGICGK